MKREMSHKGEIDKTLLIEILLEDEKERRVKIFSVSFTGLVDATKKQAAVRG